MKVRQKKVTTRKLISYKNAAAENKWKVEKDRKLQNWKKKWVEVKAKGQDKNVMQY